MSNLRERFATDLNSTHLEQGERESAIDRIAAHAHGSRLGRALWRWRYAGEERMAHEVHMSLIRALCRRWGISKGHDLFVMVVRTAKQAITEWYHDQCRQCHGAGELQAGPLRMKCETCGGDGKARYHDRERMIAICDEGLRTSARVAQWAEWEPRLREARDAIVSADVEVNMIMRWKLGRGLTREAD